MSTVAVLNTDAGLSGKTIDLLESAQTITGLKTFDLDPAAPFAVTASSSKVTNLDADKVDGVDVVAANGNRVLVSTAANAIGEAAALTNGQVLIGSTGAAPVGAAITAGTNITVTNAAGSITIAATGGSSVLDRKTTVTSINTSTTETDMYTYSVPGGTFSTNKSIRVTFIADYLNNSGGASNFTVKVKYGATTVFSSGAISMAASATRDAVFGTFVISAFGATNAQKSSGDLRVQSNGGGVAGVANAQSASMQIFSAVHTGVTEDSTGALNLKITFQHGSSGATIEGSLYTVVTELL